MPGVERQGDLATCGDPNTGSGSVFANGQGITRVNLDVAAALILGPGSQTVFCEGLNVSLPGDAILGHGLPPHASPVTANPSTDVFAGAGFATAAQTNDQGEVTQPATGGVTNIDVRIVSLEQTIPIIPNTPAPPVDYNGPLEFVIKVSNAGVDPATSFNVTLYETTNPQYFIEGDPITLPASSPLVGTDFIPLGYKTVTSLEPGEEQELIFAFPAEQVLASTPRYFTAFADVNESLVESNELNGTPPIIVPVIPID